MSASAPERNLQEALEQLERSRVHLEDSLRACLPLSGRSDHTRSELVEAEALASRFARTSDILVKQVLRALDAVELEDSGSIIDMLNRAHKREFFDDEAVAREMRRVRNEIAHEYRVKDFPALLEKIILLTPHVLEMCARARAYVKKHNIF